MDSAQGQVIRKRRHISLLIAFFLVLVLAYATLVIPRWGEPIAGSAYGGPSPPAATYACTGFADLCESDENYCPPGQLFANRYDNPQYGCYWEQVQGGMWACAGTELQCWQLTNQSACEGQSFCSWTMQSCTPDWQCTNWTVCVNGTETRSCSDLLMCGDNSSMPPETQSCVAPPSGPGLLNWSYNWSSAGAYGDYAKSIALSENGVYVSGYYNSPAGAFGAVQSLDPEGALLWSYYSSRTSVPDLLTVSADGVYYGGYTSNGVHPSSQEDWFVEKIDLVGSLAWSYNWSSALSGNDRIGALEVGPDVVYALGYGWNVVGATSGADVVLQKIGSDGLLAWSYNWSNAGNTEETGVALGVHYAAVYVAAVGSNIAAPTSRKDFLVQKVDSAGVLVWSYNWSSPGTSDDYVVDLALGVDGLYVLGYGPNVTSMTSGRDWVLQKIGYDGLLLWSYNWSSPGAEHDFAQGLALGLDGLYAVGTGRHVMSPGSDGDAVVQKVGFDGSLVWMYSWTSEGALYDLGIDIRIGDVGATFIGRGENIAEPSSLQDWIVQTLDFDGNLLWSYNWSSNNAMQDNPAELVLGFDGVYVAGRGQDVPTGVPASTASDWIVQKLNGNYDSSALPLPCFPSWSCSGWSACFAGEQTRTCADDNYCGTDVGKPSEGMSCVATAGSTLLNWSYNWTPSSGYSALADIDVGPDGVFASGSGDAVASAGSLHDWVVQKLGFDGSPLWMYNWSSVGSNTDSVYGLFVGSDGLYVTGRSENLVSAASRDDWVVQKLDSSGQLVWSYNWSSLGSFYDVVSGLFVGSDGVYASGTGWSMVSGSGDSNWVVQKLDSSGQLVWLYNWSGSASDQADEVYGLFVGSDGVYVAGRSKDIAGAFSAEDWVVQKLDFDGSMLWIYNWSSAGPNADRLSGLFVGSDGVYVAGMGVNLGGSSFNDWVVQKLDFGGQLIWSYNWSSVGSNTDSVYGLFVGSDGVYIAGRGENLAVDSSVDWVVQKLDFGGQLLWSYNWSGDENWGDDLPSGLFVGSDGLYVGGRGGNVVSSGSAGDWVVQKLDFNGQLLWSYNWSGGGSYDDAISGLFVGSDGVYVGGRGDQVVYADASSFVVQKLNTVSTPIVPCVPSWSCGDWSACSGGTQSRVCTDAYSCNDLTGKPSESQSCSSGGGNGGNGGRGGSGSSNPQVNASSGLRTREFSFGKPVEKVVARYAGFTTLQINLTNITKLPDTGHAEYFAFSLQGNVPLADADVSFSVPDEWLDERPGAEIGLYFMRDAVPILFTTTALESSLNEQHFVSRITSYGTYLIAASVPQTQSAVPPVVVEALLLPIAEEPVEIPDLPANDRSRKSLVLVLVIAGALVILLGSGAAVLLHRRLMSAQDNRLEMLRTQYVPAFVYVRQVRALGASDSQIRSKLLATGWLPGDVELLLKNA